MANFPPEHCPYCGTELVAVDPPTAFYCEAGDRPVFHNPTPSARVMVVDGERFLLVRQGVGAVEGTWLTPGGKVEAGNDVAEHAALELAEETNLTVDPADLVVCDVQAAESPEDHHIVSILFAVERAATSGRLAAGSDAAAARFWTVDELEAAADVPPPAVEGLLERRDAVLAALERA
jgi:ADP-ribose pyrophosphatase YjhB (NUDIX family)